MRDSMIFYRSFFEAIDELEPLVQVEIYKAIFEYSMNETEVELSGFPKTVWKLIKPQLDANLQRFENGKKGGRKKQKETKSEAKANQEQTKSEANNNNNVNYNVNNNVNENNNYIPSVEEFLNYSESKLNLEFSLYKFSIEKKYDAWVEGGWKDGNGKKITNWKTKLLNTIPYLKKENFAPKEKSKVQQAIEDAEWAKQKIKDMYSDEIRTI